MSVIVKGMKMPEHCEMCPIREGTFCDIINKDIDRFYGGSVKRDPDCPLVALPDTHGDLIDKDEFKETLDYYIREDGWSDEHNEALTWVKDDFIDAEMIIVEAEGES